MRSNCETGNERTSLFLTLECEFSHKTHSNKKMCKHLFATPVGNSNPFTYLEKASIRAMFSLYRSYSYIRSHVVSKSGIKIEVYLSTVLDLKKEE